MTDTGADSPLSKAIAEVDETIARSRQAVGDSLGYVQGKKAAVQYGLADRYVAEMDDSSDGELSVDSRPSGPSLEAGFAALQQERDSLEQQISAMTARLKSEVTLKHTYEKTVGELRDRVAELESRESAPQTRREAVLERKAEEQLKRIRELERAVREERGDRQYLREIEQLKGAVERLTKENQKLEVLTSRSSRVQSQASSSPHASRIDLLEQKLSALDSRCHSQFRLTEQLQGQLQSFCSHSENVALFESQLTQSQSKVEQLEEQLRRVIGMYEELRAQVRTSPLAIDSQTVTPRMHSTHSKTDFQSKLKSTTPKAPRTSKLNP